jgi:hypothetical protein
MLTSLNLAFVVVVLVHRIDSQGLLDRVFPLPADAVSHTYGDAEGVGVTASTPQSVSLRALLQDSQTYPIRVLRVSSCPTTHHICNSIQVYHTNPPSLADRNFKPPPAALASPLPALRRSDKTAPLLPTCPLVDRRGLDPYHAVAGCAA